jgi:hypothetical protein
MVTEALSLRRRERLRSTNIGTGRSIFTHADQNRVLHGPVPQTLATGRLRWSGTLYCSVFGQ